MVNISEFRASIEELAASDKYDGIVADFPLHPTVGEKHSEFIYYPPRFLPTDGCYFTASYDVQVEVTDHRLDTVESLDETVSTHEFEGEIFGFEFSNRAFELSDIDSGDSVAQIQLHPEHLPDWLVDQGDTCYISIRLEYDHEAMLDHYNEEEIEEKRKQFREQMDDMEDSK